MTEYSVQTNFNSGGLPLPVRNPKISGMPKRGPYHRARNVTPPQWRRTFVKQWRHFRKMTVEELAGAAELSAGNVSAIENQRQGYSEESLFKLAHALKTTPGALLTVDPSDGSTGDFWHLWGRATANQRGQLTEIAKTIIKPTKP